MNSKTMSKEEKIPLEEYDHLFNSEVQESKNKGFLRKLMAMHKGGIAFTSFMYLIQALPIWVIPIVSANVINIVTDAVANGGATQSDWTLIIINTAILIISLVQNVPTTVIRRKVLNRILRGSSAGIKCAVVRKLQSLSITYHKDMQTGKVQSKFLKDTDSVETLFRLLLDSFIPNILSVIVAVAISVYKNGLVSLFFLVVIPINVCLTMAFRGKIKQKNRDFRLKTENMSARLTTMLDMFMVTKSHGLENIELESVNARITETKESGLSVDKTVAYFGSCLWATNTLLRALCLVFCSILALYGKIKIGDIVLFQSMFSNISGYVTALVDMIPQISTGLEAVRSVSEIMNAKDVEINQGKSHVPDIEGNVTFQNVSFCFPNKNRYVVKDFSLEVKKGECIAVVGSSGSGKSTLMNMIIGFLLPSKGNIYIDGVNNKDINLSEYRHHISVVPQNSILFAGTIRDNITYGLEKYSQEDFERAVKMANMEEFINELPDGVDTDIGEHGDKLSGGQKQRVTIARALIRNPRILILDEATSALDNISEYHVQKAIETSIKGRTTFIVAHRLSTIRGADRIVVMEEGEMVEMGTYEELMAKKGKFFKLKELNEMNLKNAEKQLS